MFRPFVLATLLGATAAEAQTLVAQGACRDGAPHGAWQIAGQGGRLRALGAFNRGKRTGSFIFWNATGVRVAHVPYEEDEKNGTLALWYPTRTRGPDAQQRLEQPYAMGKRDGATLSWHADGQRRGEYVFENGRLLEVRGWDERGRPLNEAQARAQAEQDAADNDAYYATLDALVRAHLPICENNAKPKPR